MKSLILTKQSSENEIKNYFKAVLKLSKSKEEFPVNLDEVWPLVYPRKDHAVRELIENFIENVDYQVFPIFGENQQQGGRPTHEYILSVSCLEFFIVRKIRPVFEVYRKVFHKAAEQAKLNPASPSTVKAKILVADWVIRTLNLNENSRLIIVKSITEPFDLPLPEYTKSQGQILSATELLNRYNIQMSTQKFNTKMIEANLLKKLVRPTSKGKTTTFNNLTEKGLGYGENQVNPNNPKETQPLYYTDKFGDLLVALQVQA